MWSLLTCSSVWLWLVESHESKREWRCESKGKQQQPLLQLWWITQSYDLFLWWQAGPVFQLHCRKCTASGTSLNTGKTDNIVIVNLFFDHWTAALHPDLSNAYRWTREIWKPEFLFTVRWLNDKMRHLLHEVQWTFHPVPLIEESTVGLPPFDMSQYGTQNSHC